MTIGPFRSWVEAGTPEGDPSDSEGQSATPDDLIPMGPDVVHYPEAYLPSADNPDDYRCLPLDLKPPRKHT